jgi:transcriptional regulator GlxA family with amidase domain
MNIGFVTFDGLTVLDFVGVYDAVTRLRNGYLPDLRWDICARSERVCDNTGLSLTPTRVGQPLTGYDMLIVPGGFGTRILMHDASFVDWVRTAAGAHYKVSVCTGSLLLGAAGSLAGKRATTHPSAYELLAPFCAQVVDERVVDEGDVITARGVTSSISLGLYLCEKLAGHAAREKIGMQMDYPYEK